MQRNICTAIPYVNGVLHIGNVLTDLSGDITARYFRMRGDSVFLQVGTDENGLKIKEAAEAKGREPLEFVGEIAGRVRHTFDELSISYDDFIRTTEPRHVKTTQEVFRRLNEKGLIYQGKYEGWYDVSTETFYREEDLVDGKSPEGNPVRWVSEDNYFFKLSAFQTDIESLLENNPGFVRPSSRRPEVAGFLREGLRDICITRKNPGWGIPVPGDESKVIYVWFDAVINYLTVTGWPDDGWETKLPATVMWVGKDILVRFHATLWPAILLGLGLPLFESVVAHGWVLFAGDKISKTKGNVVLPLELISSFARQSGISEQLSVDVLRHYLSSTMSLEADTNYTPEEYDLRYNTDLANDLGNALNRSLAMAHKFVGGKVPDAEPEPEVLEAISQAKSGYETAMLEYNIPVAVHSGLGLVRFLNKYIDTRAPWVLAKNQDPALGSVLRSMLLVLRAVEGLMRPTIPFAADSLASQLNLPSLVLWESIGSPESLPVGTQLNFPQPIFPRLDLSKKAEKPMEPTTDPSVKEPVAPLPASSVPVEQVAEITIEEFSKVQLKIGRVFEAEKVEKSDKLMKLQVIIGEEKRQIVAGIQKNYAPEDLIGRQIVVCTNLKPVKLRGVESQGMILAATDADGGAILLQPEKEAPEGTKVK